MSDSSTNYRKASSSSENEVAIVFIDFVGKRSLKSERKRVSASLVWVPARSVLISDKDSAQSVASLVNNKFTELR